MSIFDKLRDAFGTKDPIKKAETLYQKGLKAAKAERFRDAISVLEEAAKLNSQSAPIHNILAFSYSRVAGEYEGDETAMASWMSKAANTFWKAITLHRQNGGLEQKQLTTAMELVAAVDRINIIQSNVPPEAERKKIFLEYKSKRESGFDLFAAAGDIIRGDSLSGMFGSLQRHSGNAEDKAIEHVTRTFGLNERQVRAIMQEGENKKWQ
jgi:tetratricopeptide (TPR) repeat protein